MKEVSVLCIQGDISDEDLYGVVEDIGFKEFFRKAKIIALTSLIIFLVGRADSISDGLLSTVSISSFLIAFVFLYVYFMYMRRCRELDEYGLAVCTYIDVPDGFDYQNTKALKKATFYMELVDGSLQKFENIKIHSVDNYIAIEYPNRILSVIPKA